LNAREHWELCKQADGENFARDFVAEEGKKGKKEFS